MRGASAARFFGPVRRAADLDVVGLLLGPADGTAFLAMDGGRPVGLLNLAPSAASEVNIAVLVADGWQRRGIATALLEHALADPRWSGCDLYATVRPDNKAVRRLLRSLPWAVRLLDTASGELYLKHSRMRDIQSRSPSAYGSADMPWRSIPGPPAYLVPGFPGPRPSIVEVIHT